MPSRQVFFTESLGTANVSSNVRTDVTALTFVNTASAAYFIGGSWSIRASEAQNNAFAQVVYQEAAATATVCDFMFAGVTASDVEGQFGFRRILTENSAGTRHVNFRLHVSANTKMSEVRNLRLWAIKATAADAYGTTETLHQIVTPTGWATACSATFTPATQGDYLVMGVGGLAIQQGGQKHRGARLLHQGSAGIGPAGYMGTYSAGGFTSPSSCFPIFDIVNCGAGSTTLEYQFGSSGALVSANANWARIAALRGDAFNAITIAASNVTASISAATFVTALTTAFMMKGGFKYGIFAMSRARASNLTHSQQVYFMADTTAGETTILNQGTAADAIWSWHPNAVMAIVTASQGTHEFRYQGRRSITGGGLDMAYQRIIVAQFDATAAIDTPTNWWYFEEDGNALDGSANADTLTRTTATRTATHKQGTYAANFASGDYFSRTWANLSAQFILKNSTTSFSVGCWVQFTTVGADRTIWTLMDSAGPNYAGIDLVYRTASSTVRGEMNVGGGVFYAAIAPTTVTTGVWYHFCFVWDGGSIILYQDGVPGAKVSAGATAPTITENLPFFVGIWDLSLTPFIGIIDELFIYRNSALSKDDVNHIITSGFPGGFSPQWYWYRDKGYRL